MKWKIDVFHLDLDILNDLDLGDNFATWCHCVISYYEQFEVFDFEMTLTFDLQLNLTLTNTLLVLECVSRYYGKYEVFDLHMTLTFDLKWPWHLHTLCLYPSPYNNNVCQYPLSLWPHPVTPSPLEPHPLLVPFIPITLSQEPHPLSFDQSHQTLLPHPHKNHTLCWYTLSFWPHPITTSLERTTPLLVPYIPIIPSQEPRPLQLPWIPITLPFTPSAEKPYPLPVLWIPLTTPLADSLRPSNHSLLPHPHKSHTLCWYPSSLLLYPRKNHILWQYPSSPLPYPLTSRRTTPFDSTLNLTVTPSPQEPHPSLVPFIPINPIPRRTTPFVGTLHQSDNIILPHLHKNHTLCWYPSSLIQHHLTPTTPHHTLCQYPSSLPTYLSIWECVIGGVLYDRIEVILLVKFHLTGSPMLYSMHWYCNEKWPVQCLLREASHIDRTVTVVVDIVLLYFWL